MKKGKPVALEHVRVLTLSAQVLVFLSKAGICLGEFDVLNIAILVVHVTSGTAHRTIVVELSVGCEKLGCHADAPM